MIAARGLTGRILALLSLLLPIVVAGDSTQKDTSRPAKSPSQSTMTTERISLRATFNRVGNVLSVRYSVDNQSNDTLLIYNRPWRSIHGRNPFPDPHQIYRSVNGSSLRLLLGAAPVPPRKRPFFQNISAVVKLWPYSVLRGEVSVLVPVTEYSCYEPDDGETTARTAQDIELFVDYSEAAGVDLLPSEAFPDAFETYKFTRRKQLRSGQSRLAIDVLQRIDLAFPRVRLPGEEIRLNL